MKLKSLILGSVAAAGLSTAGFAADLGVLTSLDVCDELGLSGLTISSDTNCLQISGGVAYEFNWGDFRTEPDIINDYDSDRNISVGDDGEDWNSKVEAYLTFIGTQASDFGPAKAVITLKEVDFTRVQSGDSLDPDDVDNDGFAFDNDGEKDAAFIDEAYVAIGDTTVLMAGKKGSIANVGDDAPFNFLGLFNSDDIDGRGILIDGDTTLLGGHVIQIQSDLGNGINVGVGLENLNGDSDITEFGEDADGEPFTQGTLVGVVGYAGENITAHVTGLAFGILDGDTESYAIHAGATGTFDAFKVRGAVGYWDNFKFRGYDVLTALGSVEATFDLFKFAVSGEVADFDDSTDYGFGGSVGVAITEGVEINLGGRYFNDDILEFGDVGSGIPGISGADTVQIAVQVVAALTETIKATGEAGVYFGEAIEANPDFDEDEIYYGAAELAWAPGGGFTSSIKGEVNSEESYKVTFKAAKDFE